MLTITPNAVKKILELLKSEPEPDTHLRIFVQGGGCSGMNYGFTFDDQQADDDLSIDISEDHSVLIDSMSSQYLVGSIVDYQSSLLESRFVITNPNATGTCGCGSSFSI